jgi:hypothetical protein
MGAAEDIMAKLNADKKIRRLIRASGSAKQRRTALTLPAVLEGYRKAFAGFSEEEMSILDGVILEPAARQARSLPLKLKKQI